MAEDPETERAIAALVYRMKTRGDADIEPVAREFMAELRARGWRPTEARVLPNWRPVGMRAEPPAEWYEARAALEEKLSHPEDAV